MKKITFKEKPTRTTRCLGCNHIFGFKKLPNGKMVKCVSWDMGDSLRQAVQSYVQVGGSSTLTKVSTPFLNDSKAARRQDDSDEPEGTLARSACSILMKLLYTARLARFDLLRAITSLASKITQWTVYCDQRLHRLMCYIHHTYDLFMTGRVAQGETLQTMNLELSADADFAGEEKAKSTSGVFLCLAGPNTLFPLAASSKRQPTTAWSTPEAETYAAAFALRTIGVPNMDLWNILNGGKDMIMEFREDNAGACTVITTGKVDKLRHTSRMQDVAANWLYDAFKKLKCLRLKQCPTKEQRADIFTKAFPLASHWYEACLKINIDAGAFLHAQPKKALVVTTYRHPCVAPLQDTQVLYRFFNPISPADNY